MESCAQVLLFPYMARSHTASPPWELTMVETL